MDVNALLRALIDFREGDWKASGIRVRDLTSREPQFVLGSHGQLEQVFLNLLVHAEQSLAQSEQKTLTIRTGLLARRLLVEISFTRARRAAQAGGDGGCFGGHAQRDRRTWRRSSADRKESGRAALRSRTAGAGQGPGRLPVRRAGARARCAKASRRMTALVIEPDEAAHRQLLALLSARGYRVVPVNNTDTGLDLSQRMRFDAAFCSLHAPGLNWVELSERMQTRVGGFILLSDGYDAELSADFEGEGRFVLAKPVQEAELDRVLKLVEPHGATIIPFKTGTA